MPNSWRDAACKLLYQKSVFGRFGTELPFPGLRRVNLFGPDIKSAVTPGRFRGGGMLKVGSRRRRAIVVALALTCSVLGVAVSAGAQETARPQSLPVPSDAI